MPGGAGPLISLPVSTCRHPTHPPLPPTQGVAFNAAGLPVFDLLLLGLGPDGHFASHFPNRLTLAEKERIVVPVEDAPTSASKRVTLSLPVVNAAAQVVFIATGAKVVRLPALPVDSRVALPIAFSVTG